MEIKIKHLLLINIFIAFLASYFFPGVGANETISTFITFIGILFGLIVGFFIADLYARYQAIRNNAAIDSSCLSTFYFFATILGQNNKEWLQGVRVRIYAYIKAFMPIPWEKYSETEDKFEAIGKSLIELKYSTDKDNETYSNILGVYSQHSDAREKLVMYGKDKLTLGEWLVITFLGGLLLSSLFYIKDTSLVSTLFTGAISSAILSLFIVIRDLNNLNFGESSVSVEPYERVLDSIGVPRDYESKRRAFI